MNDVAVTLGFMAPPMKEQFPDLNDNDAYHFDQDNLTLSRLKLRGVVSPAEAEKARGRLVKEIGRLVSRAARQAKKEQAR